MLWPLSGWSRSCSHLFVVLEESALGVHSGALRHVVRIQARGQRLRILRSMSIAMQRTRVAVPVLGRTPRAVPWASGTGVLVRSGYSLDDSGEGARNDGDIKTRCSSKHEIQENARVSTLARLPSHSRMFEALREAFMSLTVLSFAVALAVACTQVPQSDMCYWLGYRR